MDIICMWLSVADTFVYTFSWHLVLSVLWCCWLGGRKGIRPVKNWVVGCWRWCHCHTLSLASVKSRLVLPFWYRLTRVVPDKGPLNGCVSWHFISPLLFPHKPKTFPFQSAYGHRDRDWWLFCNALSVSQYYIYDFLQLTTLCYYLTKYLQILIPEI